MWFLRFLAATAFVGLILSPAAMSAQVTGKVDFARDVLPILKEHCYECHGPEKQMNGFRLDRRRDALRGGVQSDMGAGNAEGTRLYQKLIGTKVGQRMPAGKPPLPPEQIAIIKAWIDQGIVWPDEFSGEKPLLPIDANAAKVVEMLRAADDKNAQRALRKDPKLANAIAGKGGASLLMFGALYADLPTLTLMLDLGGDPNLANQVGATPLMWAADSLERARLLLARGANPNAKAEDGNTPIMVAAARIVNPRVAKLLLDAGATPPTGRALGQLRNMCPECASALPAPAPAAAVAAAGPPAGPGVPAAPPTETPTGGKAGPPMTPDPGPPTADRIRAAVQRALPPLEKYDTVFIDRTGCVSCHNNSLTTMSQDFARKSGYKVDEVALRKSSQRVADYLEGWRENILLVANLGGGQDVVSYLLTGLHAGGYAGDIATDAMVRYLLGMQEPNGAFRKAGFGSRPPLEGSAFTTTALTVRAVLAYAPKPWRADAERAVERAAQWMATTPTADTEDRTFQILGLLWAGYKGPALDIATKDFLAEQRSDGGWAQLTAMQSDPYATGEALVSLNLAGVLRPSDPAFRRGIQFLLRTQAEDGAWFVKTRTKLRIQAQFDLGFPAYGEDTWISAAATNWATMSLALAGKYGK